MRSEKKIVTKGLAKKIGTRIHKIFERYGLKCGDIRVSLYIHDKRQVAGFIGVWEENCKN